MNVFEKVLNSRSDESNKFKIIAKYNDKLDQFATTFFPEFDYAVICDILLDIFRFKPKAILDAASAINSFNATSKKGQTFTLKQFIAKVQGQQM